MRHLKGVFPIKMSFFSGVFQKSVISAFLSSEAVSIAGQSLFLVPQSFPVVRFGVMPKERKGGSILVMLPLYITFAKSVVNHFVAPF